MRIRQQLVKVIHSLSLSLIQISVKEIKQNSTTPTIFYGLIQIEHSTVNILTLRYDIQMMPPKERRRIRPRLFGQQVVAHVLFVIVQQLVAQLYFLDYKRDTIA